MKTRYDPKTDAIYVRFADATIAESEEVRPSLMLNFDAAGRIVAIEILDASKHLAIGTDLKILAPAWGELASTGRAARSYRRQTPRE